MIDVDLLKEVRVVPDFPKKGIQFFDITTVLQNPEAYQFAVEEMVRAVKNMPCDVIVGLESRGFLFASPVAYNLGKSLVLARKKGKLPYKTVSQSYGLEYGEDDFEMHEDAIRPGQNVVIIDDLLATGGTTQATVKLVEKLGGKVTGIVCLIELEDLGGRQKLSVDNVVSLIKTTE